MPQQVRTVVSTVENKNRNKTKQNEEEKQEFLEGAENHIINPNLWVEQNCFVIILQGTQKRDVFGCTISIINPQGTMIGREYCRMRLHFSKCHNHLKFSSQFQLGAITYLSSIYDLSLYIE